MLFVGQVLFRVETFAFAMQRPQPGISHADGVENRLLIKSGMILPEIPECAAGADRNGPLARLQLPRQNFHERGFPGAVGPDEAVAVAGNKLYRNVFKKSYFTEAHRDFGGCNHGRAILGEAEKSKRSAVYSRIPRKSRLLTALKLIRSLPPKPDSPLSFIKKRPQEMTSSAACCTMRFFTVKPCVRDATAYER